MKFSSLNTNERPGNWLISFSLAQRPCAQTTTVTRACSQIAEPSTWVTVFLWPVEVPNYLAVLSGGLAPQPGPFLIPFYVCFREWGEIQMQVRAESKLLFMAQLAIMLPSKFTVFFRALVYLVQISCLARKVTSLRVIRLHLQAIRKVSDTYLKSYFWMSGSTLLSLETPFMAFYGSNQTPIDFLRNWIRLSVVPAKTKKQNAVKCMHEKSCNKTCLDENVVLLEDCLCQCGCAFPWLTLNHFLIISAKFNIFKFGFFFMSYSPLKSTWD